MRTDATPLVVGQIRGVSSALHGAERRPPSRQSSIFQTVSSGNSPLWIYRRGRVMGKRRSQPCSCCVLLLCFFAVARGIYCDALWCSGKGSHEKKTRRPLRRFCLSIRRGGVYRRSRSSRRSRRRSRRSQTGSARSERGGAGRRGRRAAGGRTEEVSC